MKSFDDTFFFALSETARSTLAEDARVSAWLAQAVELATAAWPAFSPNRLAFVRLLAASVSRLPDASQYGTLRASDLYLAHACAEGDRRALAAFDAKVWPTVERALQRMRLPKANIDDLTARLREELFVRGDKRPAIVKYSGRGELAGWVRAIAIRHAVKLREKDRRFTDDEDLQLVARGPGPESAYMKRAQSATFKAALKRALSALSVFDRNLLRQHYIDGVTLDALARNRKVHRATIARRLSDLRAMVLERVRETLSEEWALSDSAIEDILRNAPAELSSSTSSLLPPPSSRPRGVKR